MLPEDTVKQLKEVLRHATARVGAGGDAGGAGFFLDDVHVLTCWHVVRELDLPRIRVRPFGPGRAERRVTEADLDEDLDLALLTVEALDERPLVPAVLLSASTPEGPVAAAGYPENPAQPGGLEVRDYKANRREGDDAIQDLRIAGENVTFGQSGGPVLDLASGAVVAVTRYTQDGAGVMGGGAVPVAHAAGRFPVVGRLLEQAPLEAREWRQVLGDDACRALGFAPPGTKTLDIYIGGDRRGWTVALTSDGSASSQLTVKDLGEGVAEVLFQLAQRGRVRTEAEVGLFGEVLSGALFPAEVQRELRRCMLADEVFVRLHVDGPLADVPWELATLPGEAGRFVAAGDHPLRLVRTCRPDASREARGPRAGRSANVLAVVVQPPDHHDGHAPVVYTQSEVVSWPPTDVLAKDLAKALDIGGRFGLAPLVNPERSELEDAVDGTPYDVVHYLGFGHYDGARAQLALCDDNKKLKFWPAAQLFEDFARTGARLVVVELAMPPVDRELEPIPPSAFSSALQGEVAAVVSTLVPVHPRQSLAFNKCLYRRLAGGSTVEQAVQQARTELCTNATLDDHACFGWFTVLTSEVSGMRLLTEEASGATSGPQILRPAEPAPPAAPPPAEGPDVFLS